MLAINLSLNVLSLIIGNSFSSPFTCFLLSLKNYFCKIRIQNNFLLKCWQHHAGKIWSLHNHNASIVCGVNCERNSITSIYVHFTTSRVKYWSGCRYPFKNKCYIVCKNHLKDPRYLEFFYHRITYAFIFAGVTIWELAITHFSRCKLYVKEYYLSRKFLSNSICKVSRNCFIFFQHDDCYQHYYLDLIKSS